MKTKVITLTRFLFFLILVTSCGSKKSISTLVTKPPLISLSPSVKQIGVLNRSIVSEDKNILDKLDKILSVEGADLDKDGSEQSILALKNELSMNPKFTGVKIVTSNTNDNPGGGVIPAPLSWDMVQKICSENNIDALFVLSLYDTDTDASYDTYTTKVNGPLGTKIPAINHSVRLVTTIKSGWRIYDPISKLIKDELLFSEKTVSTGRGINPAKAIEAAKQRKESVMQISQKIATDYALRLMPYKDNIYRKYYTSETPNFEIAKRHVETGQWDEAAKLWEIETKNEDSKIAGQACYNMAFYNEIKGDYTSALEWATKSYTNYENRLALKYIDDINERIADSKKL